MKSSAAAIVIRTFEPKIEARDSMDSFEGECVLVIFARTLAWYRVRTQITLADPGHLTA